MSGRFILASQSPRRRELLDRLGISFVCVPAEFEERCDPTLPPQLAVSELARHKAAAVRRCCGQNDWVLAADTMVVCGGRMLGKPANTEQATRVISTPCHKRPDVAYIDRLEGSYDNVVGLPLARLWAMLAEAESKEANEVDQSAAQ